MTREFISLPSFDKKWKKIGLSEDDLALLQSMISVDPEIGDMMEGTGGVRKVRIELDNNRGKSHGARVIYVDFMTYEKTYLLAVFAKGEKINLNRAEKAVMKDVVTAIKNKLRGV